MDIEQQVDKRNEVDYKFMGITSPAFESNGQLPSRYTYDGEDINPALEIDFLPSATKSLAVIMDEPDADYGTVCHWLEWNLPPDFHIKENEHRGVMGMNDLYRHSYNGPFKGDGLHRYFFRVYALDTKLDIPSSCDRMQLDKAIRNHIIGYGLLVAKYKS